MKKPTYEELLQGLCDYSNILHKLEERGVDLEEFDETWTDLTALEQGGRVE